MGVVVQERCAAGIAPALDEPQSVRGQVRFLDAHGRTRSERPMNVPQRTIPGTWPDRLRRAAERCGYRWKPAHIAVALRNMVKRHGIGPTERAWNYFTANANAEGEHPSNISPNGFARRCGYWLHRSAPAT